MKKLYKKNVKDEKIMKVVSKHTGLSVKKINQIRKNHERRVSRDNKAFDKLSPADKRVAIARDVLAQIAAQKLVPTSGTWLSGKDDSPLFDEKDVKKNPELQAILTKTKQCEGCALGGLFLCAVKKADKLKLNELEEVKKFEEWKAECGSEAFLSDESKYIYQEDAFKYLGRFFSKDQLEAIESAFEQGRGAVQEYEYSEAANFAEEVGEPEDRMRLIMENIISHKGRFVYQDEPVVKWVTPGFVG